MKGGLDLPRTEGVARTPPSGRRPFRFGVQLSRAASLAEWVSKAKWAEDVGYSTCLMPDHLGHQLAPVPALAAIAVATTSIRIGAYVFNNDMRHPVLLAKEAATLDVLSDGRLEFGLGAGWMREEYRGAGIEFDSGATRVRRMEESLSVMELLWASEPATFRGEFFTIDSLNVEPKPLQRPRPPVMIGGGGPRMLAIAARRADIVALNPRASRSGGLDWAGTTTAADVGDMVRLVRDAAGDRRESIEININVSVGQSDDADANAKEIAARWRTDADYARQSPFALIGSCQEMVDALLERRDRFGISYVTVGEAGMHVLTPVVAALSGS